MEKPIKFLSENDIPEHWRSSPIGELLRISNLKQPPPEGEVTAILIGHCPHEMQPPRFLEQIAFILDSETAEFRLDEFSVSHGLTIQGARAVALVGCPQCLEPADILSAEGQRLKSLYPISFVAMKTAR